MQDRLDVGRGQSAHKGSARSGFRMLQPYRNPGRAKTSERNFFALCVADCHRGADLARRRKVVRRSYANGLCCECGQGEPSELPFPFEFVIARVDHRPSRLGAMRSHRKPSMFSDSRKAQSNSFAHHRACLIFRSRTDEASHSPRTPHIPRDRTPLQVGVIAAMPAVSRQRPTSCGQ